jgi:hypothetical protein
MEHLRRQQAVIEFAEAGGWRALPERPIDPDAGRSRSIDVFLERRATREVAVIEIVNMLVDAGGDLRGLTDKVHAVTRELGDDWRVRGVLIVRATVTNRGTIAELASLIDSRFPASSRGWLAALSSPDTPMPEQDGFLWTRATTAGLFASRLRVRRTAESGLRPRQSLGRTADS